MLLTTQHALPLMTRGAGRIINVASLAGRTGGHPGALAYATAKAAVFGFTRSLATELAPRAITVNALAPGFIEATPFHDTFTTAESKRATITTIPAGRAGTPDDVAGPALWLASEHSSFVTGTVVDINGGQHFA
jgi:3-oxoacyl-[acyl-carrier protein] reductase